MRMFTSENFQAEVLNAKVPVLVEFSATWCGPCKAMAPTLEALSEEYAGKAIVGQLDIEDSGEIAMKYGIMNVPTILIFKNGKLMEKMNGLHNQKEIKKKIEAVLS